MDRRFLTVLGVSLVFALVVSSVFYQMTARSGAPRKAEPTDLKDLVVTTRPLSVGVMIKAADVKLSKISAEAFPKGAYSKVEEVLDRPVVSNILMEEPILEGRLAARGSGLGLAPTIPLGMRAVSVRVNDVAGVAGFVLAGMHVDVLVTGRPPGNEGDITATALQNMLVLSAGQQLQPDARGQPINAPTVTLLATPEQAETLTLANMDGHIQLILRNSSDMDTAKTPGRNISQLYTANAPGPAPKAAPTISAAPPRPRPQPAQTAQAVLPPPPPPPAAVAPAPLPDQVIMIRGNQRSVEIIPTRTGN